MREPYQASMRQQISLNRAPPRQLPILYDATGDALQLYTHRGATKLQAQQRRGQLQQQAIPGVNVPNTHGFIS